MKTLLWSLRGGGVRLWPRFLALLAGALTLALAGCAAGDSSRTAACCAKEPTGAASISDLSDRSIYQVDSSWTNDAGAALRLVNLGGRPQVVTMFFASCEYACPVLVHDMKRVEAALPEAVRGRVGFVLVTFDTERDTPAALAEYRRRHQLPANWTLLRGGPDDVLELAALLGVKFKKDARGQFAHSNLLTVLSPGGEIVHQQIGLNQSPQDTVKRLTELVHP
ncbi:MAG TPA: SCO family protein [Candidatus Saccharimonadales bacterium]|jgi:protein SCO1/2|nr:SCO family protein [Candidatus Saccharimonadales bacterium]